MASTSRTVADLRPRAETIVQHLTAGTDALIKAREIAQELYRDLDGAIPLARYQHEVWGLIERLATDLGAETFTDYVPDDDDLDRIAGEALDLIDLIDLAQTERIAA